MVENRLALDSSEELAEILPIAMVKFDRRGKVLFMNRASHKLLDSMKVAAEDLPHLLPRRHRTLVRDALWHKRVGEADWVHEGRTLHLIFQSSEDRSSVYL